MSDMTGAPHGAGPHPQEAASGQAAGAQPTQGYAPTSAHAYGAAGQAPGYVPTPGDPGFPTRVQAPRRRGGVMAIIGAVLLIVVAPAILVGGGILSAASTVANSSALVQGSMITVDVTGTASLVSISDVGHPTECVLLGGSEPVKLLKQGEAVFAGANIPPGNYTIECGPAKNADAFSFISVNATNAVKSGLVTMGISVLTSIVGLIMLTVGAIRWWNTRSV